VSLPVVLHAAQLYAASEAFRLASLTPATSNRPETVPDFSSFEDLEFTHGAAHFRIDTRNNPRVFDPAIAFFLKIAVALGGNVLLNSRRARTPEFVDRLYVRVDVGGAFVYVNRIIMDAQPGEVVRERGTNFRSHLPENLIVREAPLRDGPRKHVTGRLDAVEAILRAYDQTVDAALSPITRVDLETLLTGLLMVADGRAAERRTKGLAAA
jgi:hypothetical protein